MSFILSLRGVFDDPQLLSNRKGPWPLVQTCRQLHHIVFTPKFCFSFQIGYIHWPTMLLIVLIVCLMIFLILMFPYSFFYFLFFILYFLFFMLWKLNKEILYTYMLAMPAFLTAELIAFTAVCILFRSCVRSPVAVGTFRCSASTNRVKVMQLESKEVSFDVIFYFFASNSKLRRATFETLL